ncbi:nicotinate-nucleotide adenylyltransferase [Gracilibacillus sp. YIM 98692]|uniref:nicotinate-nucleotide adenylyltransferase n=1 Tax=Gracilibacillus sp. YIM 98692 TaxID=2663532 RepID=UPI0013D2452A|nr:nicotinate-nucleotide adenylyltransferase [Gracilibacillus sp. YIM 98692]
MKRIGLFGGTFDPPHYGHLLMAEQAFQTLSLEEVWFIPSYQPPHKDDAKTKASYRIEMTRRAVSDNPHFYVDTMEVERKGKSYTLNTIKEIKEKHPNDEFYFIIGGDMVEFLPKWHRIEELMELITFVGVKRPGYSMQTPYPVKEVEMPLVEISSTDIRRRVSNKQSIRYLTPPEVIEIIERKRLYSK